MNNKKILIAASIGIFLCMLDTTIMNITLPSIQESFNVELKDLSWALNVYTIIFASLTIPLTKTAEKIGEQRMFIFSLIIFMGASFLCGSAQNLSMLIVARLIQGIGASMLFPLSMIIGLSTTEVDNREKTIAVLGVTQGFAAAVGPTIGGIISEFITWHWVFFINIPLVIISLVLALSSFDLKLEKTLEKKNAKTDFGGAILCMIAMFSVTTFLIQGPTWQWTSTKELVLLTIAIISIVLFIYNEKHVMQPMMPLNIFNDRQFTATTITVIISNIFLIGMMVTLPSLLTKLYSFSELKAALFITPISVMIFIMSPISALLVKKVGARLLMFIGFACLFVAYAAISYLVIDTYIPLIIICTIIGFGYGVIIGPATLLAASDFTGEMLNASQSIIGVVRQIGIVVGVAIFISILSNNMITTTNDIENNVLGSQEVSMITENIENENSNSNVGLSENKIITYIEENTAQNQMGDLKIKISEFKNMLQSRYQDAYINVYKVVTPFVFIAIFTSLLFKSRKSEREAI